MQRQTRQRDAILAVLNEGTNPLTSQQILERASEEVPQLGLATVYRTLKTLMAEGSVQLVEIPGSTPHYEAVRAHHHHHFLCQTCEQVFELEGCVPKVEQLAPEAFQVERHEIILYGRCGACAAPGAKKKKR
jgi:Fur family transcriptional regulator, ferric uptake regulator